MTTPQRQQRKVQTRTAADILTTRGHGALFVAGATAAFLAFAMWGSRGAFDAPLIWLTLFDACAAFGALACYLLAWSRTPQPAAEPVAARRPLEVTHSPVTHPRPMLALPAYEQGK